MSAPTLPKSSPLEHPGIFEHAPTNPEHTAHHMLRWAGGAALGLATSYLLDQEVGHRLLWNRSKPTITEFPSDANVSHETAVLITAGFNSRPEATARPLRKAFASVGRVALFHDAATCLNFEDNFRTTLDWAHQTGTKNLIMYGPSQGSMLNVAIAPQLKAEGLNLFMLADSSPYSYDDIKGTARRTTLQILSAARSVRGGPAMRFALETLGYTIDNLPDRKSAKEVIAHSIRKMRDPDLSSNAQCFARARFLVTSNLDPHMAGLQDVPFVYMGTDTPANDRVVNNVSAYNSYQARHNEHIPHITDPRVGHANPDANPDAHRAMTIQALRALDLKVS